MPPKNKKGKAPAHQNKFAFRHNPKSKKTAKILESPNTHVCRRCHEKIEWRKKYRKYKPRTQPGRCNLCDKRNVLAAYHTICVACTTDSPQARDLLEDEHRRICAVCVKEPALEEEPNHECEVSELLNGATRLRLRDRKTLERKLAKTKSRTRETDEDGRDTGDDELEQENSDLEVDDANDLLEEPGDCSEEEDPFLSAVGGADKLLTGEAYQQMLLHQEKK